MLPLQPAGVGQYIYSIFQRPSRAIQDKMAPSTDSRPLSGKVCLVTGATRGIGKGIALQLGEAGATVYITGRTLHPPKDKIGGSLQETKNEVESRGGKCIPIVCDHSDDEQIKALFETIKAEQNGQLDILVNNAHSAVRHAFENGNVKFYDNDPELWDNYNRVGIRNNYFCTVYASRLMVPRKQGLIVNMSSVAGLSYTGINLLFGIGHNACDRMATDCAIELEDSNVAMVSLWPMAVKTELCLEMAATMGGRMHELLEDAESPAYVGMCIVSLATDPNIMSKSGKVLCTGNLADDYNLVDTNGIKPGGINHLYVILDYFGYTRLAAITPRFLKIPKWIIQFEYHNM